MSPLRDHLACAEPGPLADTSKLERLLAGCWDGLAGSDGGGMEAHKLLGRMEQVVWNPPVLTFVIERHGGTACGSTRADLQHWRVDLAANEATITKVGHRQLWPMAARVSVKAVAGEIARSILDGVEDERVYRQADGSVRVAARALYPDGSGYRRTVESRRTRLCQHVEAALAGPGWVKRGRNVFVMKS